MSSIRDIIIFHAKKPETGIILPKVQMRKPRLTVLTERQAKLQGQGLNPADQPPKPVLLTAI